MTRFKVLATVLTVIAGMLTLAAPAQAVNTTVTGRVYVQSQAVMEATVTFFADCEAYADDDAAGSARLNAEGVYTVSVPPGSYVARIEPVGDAIAVLSWHAAAPSCYEAASITVPATPSTRDLYAAAGVTVSGNVVDARGDPVTGTVTFYTSCTAFSRGRQTGEARIEAGKYSLPLPIGTYKARIEPDEGTSSLTAWDGAAASCAGATIHEIMSTTPLDLTTRAGTLLTGKVVVGTMLGNSLSVVFYRTCDDFLRDHPVTYVSNVYGEYAATLPEGDYKARLATYNSAGGMLNSWHDAVESCDQAATLSVSGKTMSEELHGKAGSLLTGTVTVAGGAVPSWGSISFYTSCGAFEARQVTASTYIEWNGAYWATLPADTYVVWIEPGDGSGLASFHNGVTACADATPIKVVSQPGDPPQLEDLVASAGVTVSGAVTTTKGGAVTSGEMSFYTECGHEQDGYTPFNGPTYTAALAPGTYYVRIYTNEAGAVPSWNGGSATCAGSVPLVVTTPTDKADLVVAAGESVTGTVSIAMLGGDVPVDSAWISFYADCDATEPAAQGDLSDGTFEVPVPPGTYRVQITPYTPQALESWHSAKRYCDDAEVVTIAGPTTLTLKVRSASLLKGTVSSAKGPVTAGSVVFYENCENLLQAQTYAVYIRDGRYHASLPEGTYRLLVYPEGAGHAVNSWNGGAASCEESTPVTVKGATTANVTVAVGTDIAGQAFMGGSLLDRGRVVFFSDCGGKAIESREIDREGTYEVSLAPGSYAVQIIENSMGGSAIGWHNAKRSCSTADRIQVGQADMYRDLNAPPVAHFTGTMSTAAGLVEWGRAQFFATCQDYLNANSSGVGYARSGQLDSWLPAGTYFVRLYPMAEGAPSWNGGRATCAGSTTVTVPGSAALLAGSGVTVTGSVTTSKGTVRRGHVEFYPDCWAASRGFDSGSATVTAGTYSRAIMPGTYRVRITPEEPTSAAISWHSAQADCGEATPVTVSAAGTLDLRGLAKGEVPFVEPIEPVTPVTPVTPVAPAKQTVRKPPAKLKKGAKAKLARKTAQGSRLTWKTKTRKICTVKKYVLTARKKGVCKLSAKAPAGTGFTAYSRTFRIRVR